MINDLEVSDFEVFPTSAVLVDQSYFVPVRKKLQMKLFKLFLLISLALSKRRKNKEKVLFLAIYKTKFSFQERSSRMGEIDDSKESQNFRF